MSKKSKKEEEEEDDGVVIYLPSDNEEEEESEVNVALEECNQQNVSQEQDSDEEDSQDSEEELESNSEKDLISANLPKLQLPKKHQNHQNQNHQDQKKGVVYLDQDQKKGVVYLGRIPHGFYEQEMKSYFSQFGTVSRLRLSRNKKTGHSKHYAFIEFESRKVAEIVAETMNNYLLFNRLLKCIHLFSCL